MSDSPPATADDVLPSRSSRLAVLGPGILYAGAAVGISHLVQSTRAGAGYGLALWLVIVLACLIKYPALRFGGEYAAATGKNLVQSYRERGWWAIGIYGAAQLFSMSFAVASVTLVNVGLLKATLGLAVDDVLLAGLLLTGGATLLFSGRYHLLERLTKLIVAAFTVLIVLATLLVVGRIEWSLSGLALPHLDYPLMLFVIALIGFMPSPIDAGVMQSLWTCAKRHRGRLLTPTESRLDFNVGYVTSVVLALAFMLLGAGVMHRSGIQPPTDSAGFATQVIELFTSTIGSWAYPVISVAAIAVMLSSLLTLLDGYPRIAAAIVHSFARGQETAEADGMSPPGRSKAYDVAVVALAFGVMSVLTVFRTSFTAFIDMTALIVFLTAPLLAYLNHSAMFGADVPARHRPGSLLRVWSMGGVAVMLAAAALYLFFRYGA